MREKKPLPTATPEQVGIPSSAILQFLDRLENKKLCMHSFIVLRFGKIAAEGYWSPFHAHKKHRMYSCTKSFVSIAIGLMEEEGLLSLGDQVIRFFPEKLPEEGVHPYIAQMTIRDLLMMASAHEKTTYKQIKDDDWVRTFFQAAPSHLPGTMFFYDTSATVTLTAIVEKLSGMSLLDYLRPRLLDPIGFSEDAYCLQTPLGVSHGGSALICTSRDLAKFALVCMNKGRFNGEQLIPEEYILAATSRQIDTTHTLDTFYEAQQGYGYQFWRTSHGGFALRGMGGQLAICLPEDDLLVVTTADLQPNPDGTQIVFDALWDTIYSSLAAHSLPDDEEAYNELLDRTSQLSIMLPDGSSHSSKAAEINGNGYRLADNPMGISQIHFEFNGDEGALYFENSRGTHRLGFGLGKTVSQKFPLYGYDSLSAAAWVDSNSLLIYSYIIDDYFGTVRTKVYFGADTVTIVMRKYAEGFLDEYSGIASGERVSGAG
ncbi:serine hydrolase domain-containing protein [Paenibacillus sp. SAFN-117]|uniref:serine hydrolase domain-containing protein n=1 Tax=Paenibacillus sp. SAFN-117 TaxID=3436860 RepID=UPI003F82024F